MNQQGPSNQNLQTLPPPLPPRPQGAGVELNSINQFGGGFGQPYNTGYGSYGVNPYGGM